MPFPLIIRIYQHIVNLCQHFAVVQCANQANQFVTIPDGQYRGRVHQSFVKPLWILAGHPTH